MSINGSVLESMVIYMYIYDIYMLYHSFTSFFANLVGGKKPFPGAAPPDGKGFFKESPAGMRFFRESPAGKGFFRDTLFLVITFLNRRRF